MIAFRVESEPARVDLPAPAEPRVNPARGLSSVHALVAQLRRLVASPAASDTMVVTSIVGVALALRLLYLQSLPAEMWGDVITHYQLAQQVMQGHLYWNYQFGGDGPMFSYIVADLARIFGLSFYTIKLATALIGTLLTGAIYFLTREMFNRKDLAYIACFLCAVSFWTLTFSRQAKPYILVPLFVSLSILFALRRNHILAGISLGLGMYTQAAFWGTPFAFVAYVPALIIGGIVALPVLSDFAHNFNAYFGGGSYIGEKLGTGGHISVFGLIGRMLSNLGKNLLSFNVNGDVVFRHNIVGHPDLDAVSGIFFVLGGVLIALKTIRERDTRLLLWLIVPFFAIQIPSVLDSHALNVPSMARMLGIVPFVYMAIAYAIAESATWCRDALSERSRLRPYAWRGFVAVALIAILAINFRNYFFVYPKGLPNGNTPFGATIAQTIDTYPRSELVIVVGCCWGQWAQPEPGGIQYQLRVPRAVAFVQQSSQVLDIARMTYGSGVHRVVVVRSPAARNAIAGGIPFVGEPKEYMVRKNGWDVAWVNEGSIEAGK